MKTLIKVDHLHLGYDNQEVINDLSFDIQQGDFITVLGQNGAGKSTLIKGLLGLIKPMAGQITYYMNEREIGYTPQVHVPVRFIHHAVPIGKISAPIVHHQISLPNRRCHIVSVRNPNSEYERKNNP